LGISFLCICCKQKEYSNFKEHAIAYVKQAVKEDDDGNYSKAFPLYMNALEYFRTHLKYETNPKIKEAITQKFMKYLRRAEEIRVILDSKTSLQMCSFSMAPIKL
jgi:vacuolar protein-sorting-associated protein 4